METNHLSFSGGLILGAGLVCLFDPQRKKGHCIAGALGVAAVAYGARLFAERARGGSTSTALDIDMPNYAWLR